MAAGVSVVLNIGVGYTVITKSPLVPVQPFAEGITVTVATALVVPLFAALKAEIFPVPLAARPTDVLSLLQLNNTPVTAPVNVIAVVAAVLHRVWLLIVFTVGVG